MYQEEKQAEAQYFYDRMIQEQQTPQYFGYNLSAFLSASRSSLQYIYREVKSNTQAKAWYKAYMSSSSVLKFFRDRRDINIHIEPVQPEVALQINVAESVVVSDSVSVAIPSGDRNTESEHSSSSPPPKPRASAGSVSLGPKYTLEDWEGNEDIPTLCEMYIEELANMIQDGLSKGYIT